MDTSSIAIGVLLMLLFVGPIMYMILKQNNQDKNRLKNLKNISNQHQLELNEFELTNSLLLGLDSRAKKLVVVEPLNNMQYNIIDLNAVKVSHVSKKGLPQVNGTKGDPAITHISLDLLQKNSKENAAEIVFYDEDDDTSYNVETQMFLANKWDRLIRSNIPT
ncbi:hypothetical protein FK178_11840 [Antarcticibacterium arcticum]|uniref:Uncharacterized protein n=1 Tax=Antarcticibacterium arcticum TaxID=2585771 RepID=A0A5B8YNZ7_9FLAO|nr:hypothetical protein [Antarcticibacterium arcticum]QED38363.1 hypothetical protein FK178_11840 [Antarcticibacterium arcticum]